MTKEKEKYKPVFNIAVVGLSGAEQYKGSSGVGKSCLCNRFVRSLADDYYPEHTSVLSQSDFGGRVVSNDHFLYWGDTKRVDDNGIQYKFNIVEQTEFIDDQSYQPHRSSSNQVYQKRCAQTKLSSAEKLMYICTDQLGIESDFEQKPMPEGKLSIDGFLLCFDVSHVTNRAIDDQVKFVQNCYHYLSKTKKPIVLALTKCDEKLEPFAKEAEKFANTPGGKKGSLPIIETSAEENINIELAFMVLAQLIDKARSKSKIISYEDASKLRQEVLNQATEDLTKLLSEVVRDYHETWVTARKNLEDKQPYKRYVELLGKNFASKIFRKHVNRLRDEYKMAMQNDFLRHLSRALKMILSDLSLIGSTWQETMQTMKEQPKYNSWFIQLDSCNTPWYENDHVNSLDDRRIPEELLCTPDAENAFLTHKRELEQKHYRHNMKLNFKQTLADSPHVAPGREWGDVVRYFKQHDFLSELTETELSTIYENFQAEITEKAKIDFQELLYEKAEVFVSGNTRRLGTTQMDIHNALQSDRRYIAMDYLTKERDDILTRHISGMLYPNQDMWGARCLKQLVPAIKKTKPRDNVLPSKKWQLTPDSKTLNVVLLGADGLSSELANEITVQSSEDAYTLDGCIHTLRLRCIDGDVSSPSNSLKTSSFSPHGCIAVYSSPESLKYIQKSLNQTVIPSADGSSSQPPPFQGLPVSILLACQAGSGQHVSKLRSEGDKLAALLGCPFIDVMEPEYAYNRRFHESQIKLAMKSLINGIKERAAVADWETPADADLIIVACTMADDFFGAEVAVTPLLNHSSCKIIKREDEKGEKEKDSSSIDEDREDNPPGDSLTIETYLGTQRRKVQVTVTSYQSARHLLNHRQTAVHGFLLLFDTNRPASFAVMKVFAKYTVSAYPIQMVCMSSKSKDSFSNRFFRDPESQRVVIEANRLADELQARFMTVCPNHMKQTEVYTTFFKDAWEHKDQTEAINSINRAVTEDSRDATEVDSLDLSLDASKDENSHSRPMTPEKSQLAGTSSTESLPTSILRPAPPDRSVSTPCSDTSLPVPLSRNARTPTTESETSWIIGGDYRSETPSTSPTAGLLDNEESPALSDYMADNKAPASKSGGNVPGKIDPDRIRKVAPVLNKAMNNNIHQIKHQKSFTEGVTDTQTQYLDTFDPKRTGQRVLPQIDISPSTGPKGDHLKTMENSHSTSSPHSLSKFFHSKPSHASSSSLAPITRRPTPYKNSKKTPLKSGDETFDGAVNGTKINRYSTAGILESKFEAEPSGMRRGTSHELLHPSMPGYRDFTAAFTPKEEKLMKQKAKDEEKRRRDEEKRREKDQQKRQKDKGPKNGVQGGKAIGSNVVGNHHTVSAYFNRELDDIIQGLNHMIPLFVEKCIQFIEKNGISTEGLYRIPANAKERENILRKFDEDNDIELSTLEVTVQTVAGCVTWFFSHKNLPTPLIPQNLHEELEEAISMPESSLRNLSVRGVIRKLPHSHYATFKYLCKHLNKVCQHESENKMNSENIAICWWPTLFRPELNDMKTVSFDRPCLKDVLLTCIVQCGFIFYNQPEV